METSSRESCIAVFRHCSRQQFQLHYKSGAKSNITWHADQNLLVQDGSLPETQVVEGPQEDGLCKGISSDAQGGFPNGIPYIPVLPRASLGPALNAEGEAPLVEPNQGDKSMPAICDFPHIEPGASTIQQQNLEPSTEKPGQPQQNREPSQKKPGQVQQNQEPSNEKPHEIQETFKEKLGQPQQNREPSEKKLGQSPEIQEPSKEKLGQSHEIQEPSKEKLGQSHEIQEPSKEKLGQSHEIQEPSKEKPHQPHKMHKPSLSATPTKVTSPVPTAAPPVPSNPNPMPAEAPGTSSHHALSELKPKPARPMMHAEMGPTPSLNAQDRRIRRLMTPLANGSHRISERVRDLWNNKETKDQVFTMFAECNYDPDRGGSETQAAALPSQLKRSSRLDLIYVFYGMKPCRKSLQSGSPSQ